jgi:hypothetical protein
MFLPPAVVVERLHSCASFPLRLATSLERDPMGSTTAICSMMAEAG